MPPHEVFAFWFRVKNTRERKRLKISRLTWQERARMTPASVKKRANVFSRLRTLVRAATCSGKCVLVQDLYTIRGWDAEIDSFGFASMYFVCLHVKPSGGWTPVTKYLNNLSLQDLTPEGS